MALSPTCDLFVLTGEPSGDAYGGAIVAALKRTQPDLVVAAMGGPALAGAGAEIEQDIEGMAVMGLGPVLARLPSLMKTMDRVTAAISARRPRAILSIDYPGMNFRLLHRLRGLRRQGTRLLHVVAPQVWAWRPRRAKGYAQAIDRLFCFFPFEPPLFSRHGCRAEFVGHPLLDLVPDRTDTAGIDAELGIPAERPLLLLAPGSREREVATLLPIYHQAAEHFQRLEGRRIAIAVSRVPDIPIQRYRDATHFPLVEGHYRELCARAHVALVASGTATLEAALLGAPHVIAYRTDRLTAMLARRVLIAPHVGLPNLVADGRIVPEVLQDQLTPVRLVAHLRRLWSGPARARMLADLALVRQRLGGGGAVQRIADAVADEILSGRRRATFGSGFYSEDDDRPRRS